MISSTRFALSSSTSRRERRKQETRAKLLASAIELIAELGFARTSIDDIARRADVARGTAVNYFGRKEDYLVALAVERQAIFARALVDERASALGPVVPRRSLSLGGGWRPPLLTTAAPSPLDGNAYAAN